jgi:DNA-binding NarL/FixJ family response regulator
VIRVLLVDDQAIVRAGFRVILDMADGIEVVGEAGDGPAAVELAARLRPDVVCMDVRMPGGDGLAATRGILDLARERGFRPPEILVITTFDLDEYVFEAIRAGASGFLVKDTEPADLVRAVRVAAAGDALLSPGVTRRLLARVADATRDVPPPRGLDDLTAREREVLVEVAGGWSNDEIAGRLYLSESTVKTHVSRVLTKLGARDRAQLVVIAYETGVVRPGWLG